MVQLISATAKVIIIVGIDVTRVSVLTVLISVSVSGLTLEIPFNSEYCSVIYSNHTKLLMWEAHRCPTLRGTSHDSIPQQQRSNCREMSLSQRRQ
jgi:hypothetical protein